MPKEEIPPEHLWEDTEGLEAWWESVNDKREDGMRTVSGRRDDDDDDDGDGPVMVQNDYAKALKGVMKG